MAKRFIILLGIALSLLAAARRTAGAETVRPGEAEVRGSRPAEVTVRFSKNEGFNRIVFEADDESFIKNTVVSSSQDRIKVRFPSGFTLKPQNAVDVVASMKGRTYEVIPGGPFKIKVMKLSAPPRLSIDIATTAKGEAEKSLRPKGAAVDTFPNIRVAVDPGHGGYDIGIIAGELREKDITLSVSKEIEAALLKMNRTVFLTRKSDQFLSITDRAVAVGQRPSDVFMSLHLSLTDSFVIYTSSPEPPVSDAVPVEFYALNARQRKFAEKSRALAESLGKVIKDEFGTEIVLRDMHLPLLNSVAAPAVLIELPKTIVYDKTTRSRISEALLKGISVYAGR